LVASERTVRDVQASADRADGGPKAVPTIAVVRTLDRIVGQRTVCKDYLPSLIPNTGTESVPGLRNHSSVGQSKSFDCEWNIAGHLEEPDGIPAAQDDLIPITIQGGAFGDEDRVSEGEGTICAEQYGTAANEGRFQVSLGQVTNRATGENRTR
jgi:hypothetical protein